MGVTSTGGLGKGRKDGVHLLGGDTGAGILHLEMQEEASGGIRRLGALREDNRGSIQVLAFRQ